MNKYRAAMQEAVGIALAGDPHAAIAPLDAVMDDALTEGAKSWAALLVSNAAIFSEQSRDAAGACRYYQRFLDRFGDDDRMLFGLARSYASLGDRASVVRYRSLARQAAVASGNGDLLEVLDKWEGDESKSQS